jgi:DNA repair protein RadC
MTTSAKKNDTPTPLHSGHRERLRERFLQSGDGALADHELLELILFYAIPRRDTKPLAKQLLQSFGSLAGVLSARADDLSAVSGLSDNSAALLKAIQAAAARMGQRTVMKQAVLSNWEQLLSYCHIAMAHEASEQLRVLFLDKKNKLIADEVQQRGTVDHTPAYPREIIKRALNLGASAIILVHNHPSGDPQPSRADMALTDTVAEAAQMIGITLHDHVIIAKAAHYSFRSEGLIR